MNSRISLILSISLCLCIFLTHGIGQTICNGKFLECFGTPACDSLVARDWIKMTGIVSLPLGTEFKARIDETLILDSEYLPSQPPAERILDNTLKVGSLPGSFNVNSTGSAIYTISLDLPPGTAGMKPEVSLFYNSLKGNGIMGIGWALSGLSAISRAGHDRFNEGDIQPVSYSNDRLLLDGQRLILSAGSWFVTNSEYKTQHESFKRIKYNGIGFEVESPNGTKVYYGESDQSQLKKSASDILAWYISRIVDQYGNTINYYYRNIQDTKEILLDRIEYTKTNTFGAYNKVQFLYENARPDYMTYYNAGIKSNADHILRKITVYANGQRIRDYSLKYFTNGNLDSYLSSIELTGESELKINSTRFNWIDKPEKDFINSESIVFEDTANLSSISAQMKRTRINETFPLFDHQIFEFDGDGSSDILTIPTKHNSSGELVIQYGNLSGSITMEMPVGFKGAFPIDIDGDGKQEIFFHKGVGTPSIGFSLNSKRNYEGADSIEGSDLQFRIYKFQDNNLTEIQTTDNYGITGLSNHKYGIMPGDYDGNGLTDLLFYSKDMAKLFFQLYLAEVNPSGSVTFVKRYDSMDIFFSVSDVYAADINGDGKQDIICCNDEGIHFSAFNKIAGQNGYSLANWTVIKSLTANPGEISFGDYNGDGQTDIIAPNNRSVFYGTGTSSPIMVEESLSERYSFGADYNGDGKSELFKSNLPCGNPSILTSEFIYTSGNPIILNRTLLPYAKEMANLYGDFNGDGLVENLYYYVAITQTPGKAYEHIVHKVELLSLNHDRGNKILGSVLDGMNRKTEVEYENTTSGTVYTKNEISNISTPVRTINPVLLVVRKTKSDNGINGQDSVIYYYKNARIHIDGRGFLGFGELIVENPIIGIRTNTINRFDNTYYDPLPWFSITTAISSGKRLSGVYSAFKTHAYNANGQKHYLIYPDTTSNWDYQKMQKQKISYNYTINDFVHGNFSSANAAYYNVGASLQMDASISLTNTYESFNNGKFYRLKSSALIKKRPGNTDFKQKKSFHFISSSSNRVNKEIIYYYTTAGVEDTDKDTITYSFDVYGNAKKTIFQLGNDKRYDTLTFDQYGRFALTLTNSLGHTVRSGYDDKGYLTFNEDVNGIRTTNLYDGFGQVTAIDNPDGSDQEMVTSWVSDTDNDKPLYACYYSLITTIGKPFKKVYYDILGRPLRTVTEALNGKLIFTDVLYNTKGQQIQHSDPYFKGETVIWNYFSYDAEGRISSQFRAGNLKKVNFNYDKNKLTQTFVNTGEVYTKTIDATGLMIQASDPEGTINYNYYSSGSLKQVVAPQSTINIEYNKFGTQSKLIDPDAGDFEYEYNAYGELNYQKDSKNDWYRITGRDKLGRPLSKTTSDGDIINFAYDQQLKGMIDHVVHSNGTATEYIYDDLGRMKSLEETIQGQEYLTSYVYDNYSNLIQTTYHTGASINYIYNIKGYLTGINRYRYGTSPQILWNAGDVNALGQWKNFSIGGILDRSFTFNSLGMVSSIVTGTVQNLQYSFNEETGNLTFRKDLLKNLQEDFTYINNKLTSWKVGANTWSVAYKSDGTGRMDSKTDAGSYVYETSGIHKVSGLNNNPGTYNGFPADITYTAFNKIDSISETGGYKLKYIYGPDEHRKVSRLYNNANVKAKEIIYLSNGCEIERSASNTRTLHYIPLGGSCWALMVDNSSMSDSTYFILTDHLGSAHVITDISGTKLKEFSFDPWGRRRNPADWTYNNVPAVSVISRGFTMHEHMDQFNLINMNGRAYDPIMGQFLSADPFVQNPSSTVNYNRYSYCMNNPLNRIDPSGYVGEDLIDRASGKPYWLVRILLACDGRGGTLYSDSPPATIVRDLLNSSYGGTWNSSTGTTTYFSSDEEALGYGMAYVEHYGDWQYTEHKSAEGTAYEYIMKKHREDYFDEVENSGSEYYLASVNGEPIIKSPYSYCESSNSWKNLFYWYEYVGNNVDRIFEGDCNDGVAPKFVQFVSGSFITPTSLIVNIATFVTGNDPFTGEELNNFHRYVKPVVSIIFSSEKYFPVGTDWIWDLGVDFNFPKEPKNEN